MTTDPQKTVFISYRRDSNPLIARAIFQDLHRRRYKVFMDVESIDSGQFDTVILNQIAARAHFLVVLTVGTVERCTDSQDWLRREIEYAMDLKRNIVPILYDGFTFEGTEAYLTGKLSELRRYNGVPLSHALFSPAMDLLCKRFLKQHINGEIKIVPPKEQAEAQRRIGEVADQPAPTEEQLIAEQYFNLGLDCDGKGDYSGALANYSEALRLNPQLIKAYCLRAGVRFSQEDVTGAIGDLNEALRLDPQFINGYVVRGCVRATQGDLVGAVVDFTECIRLDPQNARHYSYRGDAYRSLKDYQHAIINYNEALRLNPQYADAYNNRGIVYEDHGDYWQALENYEAALRIEPEHNFAGNNRENLLKKMNEQK